MVVVLSPPIPSFDLHSCLSRGVSISEKKDCKIGRPSVDAAQTYRQFMLPYLAEEGVNFFDPVAFMCNQSNCNLGDNGQKVYFSAGIHLSGNGGAYLSGLGGSDFVKLLQSASR